MCFNLIILPFFLGYSIDEGNFRKCDVIACLFMVYALYQAYVLFRLYMGFRRLATEDKVKKVGLKHLTGDVNCEETKYGCCYDGITSRSNNDGTNNYGCPPSES
jgi:hypothetical protein